jgi:hypothetical protein
VPGTVSGRLLGTSDAWYSFTFPSESGKAGTDYTIELIANGNPIAMTVFVNCSSSTVSCGGGEPTTGYTDWEWNNTDPGFSPSQYTDTYPTTFYVQVFATGFASTCMDFTLVSFSN